MFKIHLYTCLYSAVICLLCLLFLSSCNNNVNAEAFYDSPEYAAALYADVKGESYGLPVDGMFFSTENVVEACEYDDAYAIVYDDPDAEIRNAEIIVDRQTYEVALWAAAEDDHFTGTLHNIGGVWKFKFATE